MFAKIKQQKGFSLLELLLYVGLTGVILLTTSTFFVSTIESRTKSQTIAEVESQGVQAMQIIGQKIRNATTINSPSAGSSDTNLSLNDGGIVFDVSSGQLRIDEGTPVNLTSSKITVSDVDFYNLSRDGAPGIIRTEFTISYNNSSGKNEYEYSKTFYNSTIAYSASTSTPAVPDTTPPAAISDLSLSGATTNSIDLDWTAPGDDGSTGSATSYDVRYSTSVINDGNWAGATQVIGEPSPSSAGSAESMTVSGLDENTTYYFAIKTSDEVPNESALSNVPSLATLAGAASWDNPTNSYSTGFDGNQNGWKIQVSGSYAYMVRTSGNPEFIILDLSDPDNPSVESSITVSGGPRNIYVSGNYAYIVGTSNGNELLIYNISTPSSPSLSGTFNADGNANAFDIYVVGSTAYMVRDSSGDDELVIIDVSNPGAPSELGSLNLTADGNEIYVSGNYAYIASDDDAEHLQIVDISNPGSLSIDAGVDLTGNTNCDTVTGFGTTVILGCSNGDLHVIDITTPTSPSILGSDTASVNDDLRDLSLDNSNTYVFAATDDNTYEFAVYDISTLSAPTLFGSVNVSGDLNGVAYYPTGDRAYAVGDNNTNELRVFAPQ